MSSKNLKRLKSEILPLLVALSTGLSSGCNSNVDDKTDKMMECTVYSTDCDGNEIRLNSNYISANQNYRVGYVKHDSFVASSDIDMGDFEENDLYLHGREIKYYESILVNGKETIYSYNGGYVYDENNKKCLLPSSGIIPSGANVKYCCWEYSNVLLSTEEVYEVCKLDRDTYKISKDESLEDVAKKYDTSVNVLMAINDIEYDDNCNIIVNPEQELTVVNKQKKYIKNR